MSPFQDIKAAAREQLHEHMSRAVVLYRDADDTSPVSLTARYHDESKKVGDLAGTNLSYAEQMERPAQAVFWRTQLNAVPVDLDRGMFIIFSATEGYHLELVHPADGATIKADVTPMRASELSGKEAPDGTIIP